MKNTSQQYLNSEAHGYLMEAKACKLSVKESRGQPQSGALKQATCKGNF